MCSHRTSTRQTPARAPVARGALTRKCWHRTCSRRASTSGIPAVEVCRPSDGMEQEVDTAVTADPPPRNCPCQRRFDSFIDAVPANLSVPLARRTAHRYDGSYGGASPQPQPENQPHPPDDNRLDPRKDALLGCDREVAVLGVDVAAMSLSHRRRQPGRRRSRRGCRRAARSAPTGRRRARGRAHRSSGRPSRAGA